MCYNTLVLQTAHGELQDKHTTFIKKFLYLEDKPMAKKYCYLFSEGNATMREILGGKGANLAEMTNIGLPVPQGFTISTEACTQ